MVLREALTSKRATPQDFGPGPLHATPITLPSPDFGALRPHLVKYRVSQNTRIPSNWPYFGHFNVFFFLFIFIGFCYQVQFKKYESVTFALSAYCAKIMDISC